MKNRKSFSIDLGLPFRNARGIGMAASLLFLSILFSPLKVQANPSLGMDIGGESEVKVSSFDHSPRPEGFAAGANVAQQYLILVDGGLGSKGYLDSILGLAFGDKYRTDELDLQDKVHLQYGPWLEMSAESHQETDEDVFFAGPSEPQSPIYTTNKKIRSRLAANKTISVEHQYENTKRTGLIPGSATGEQTNLNTIRARRETDPLKMNAEYRKRNFEDLLGLRSNVDSNDLNMELYYRPRQYIILSSMIENSEDLDLTKRTELDSQLRNMEVTLRPTKELRLRGRFKSHDDRDTQTNENIVNLGSELIFNFDPSRHVGFEYAIKQEDEDKERLSTEIPSTTNGQRIRIRLVPIRAIIIQGGYELSDKESSSEAENIERGEKVMDISFQPLASLRISGQVSNEAQENPLRSTIESETNSVSGTVHYQPKRMFGIFVQVNNTETDNPATGAFTITDTVSSSIRIQPLRYLSASFRTSGQSSDGSSAEADAERLLNAVQVTIQCLKNLKISGEYEIISSTGSGTSDENLYDFSIFYNIGRFDFSVRLQKREITGEKANNKVAMLGNAKYRFYKDASFGLRLSIVDYADEVSTSSSFDSTALESLFSMKF